MIYKYQFTNKAKDDLDSIINYIAIELANINAAQNLIREVEKGIEQICTFPKICPVITNVYVRNLGIRKKVIKNFIMYYLPDKKTKTNIIIRFVYGKRDMNEVLKNINFKKE